MIHGDRSQSQRTSALAGFQQGRFRVLVATDLASRGIHVQDIAHVINYDLPDVAENFIHRIGRTGRAGERGVASTFFSREQRTELFQLERTLGIRMDRVSGPTERVGKEPAYGAKTRAASRSTLIRLPGEFLQAQLEG
jgi:ATP-dependent RNA helicase RhlE